MSNPGRKRGRGKGAGKKIAKDLNRGQIIGIGNNECQAVVLVVDYILSVTSNRKGKYAMAWIDHAHHTRQGNCGKKATSA